MFGTVFMGSIHNLILVTASLLKENQDKPCVSNAVKDDLIHAIGVDAQQLKQFITTIIMEIQHKASQPNPFAGKAYILHVGRFHNDKID